MRPDPGAPHYISRNYGQRERRRAARRGADPESSLYGSANGQGFYNFITPGTKGYNFALNVTF